MADTNNIANNFTSSLWLRVENTVLEWFGPETLISPSVAPSGSLPTPYDKYQTSKQTFSISLGSRSILT